MDHERILHILDYLTRNTHDGKGVTLRDIQAHLANYGMRDVAPLTLRRDIDRMIASGYDVQITHGAHNTAFYSLQTRGFTFNEIRFIVDSVSINKFLSDRQKQRLIEKFEVLCSEDEVRQLISRITLNSQSAPSMNLLENLDKVHRVISEKCKINFEYGKYDTNRQVQYYNKRRNMIPCKVIYFSERFYLRCADAETGETRTYRIDRMKHITAGEPFKKRPVLPKPEGAILDVFEPESYAAVTLRVKRVLLDDMLEQFGSFATVLREDPDGFVQLRARVGISQGFFRWMMKYGNDLELLAPAELREMFRQKIVDTLSLYQAPESF
jgi:predicted DNA-binding transcriptional regulator YafY